MLVAGFGVDVVEIYEVRPAGSDWRGDQNGFVW
jgi:hypothetical protein